MIRSLVGTVNWQAPELWHPHPRYDYKVDVFSAGMVYWEMMSGWTCEKVSVEAVLLFSWHSLRQFCAPTLYRSSTLPELTFSRVPLHLNHSGSFSDTQKYPWEGHNEHYIYDAVGAKHRRPPLTGLRKHWGNEPVALMERMWHQDPGERPTMTDVVTDLEVLFKAAPKS